MLVRVIVHTLVHRDGKLLFIRRRQRDNAMYGGMWDVSGGLLEIAEHPEEGARRELREEANMEVGCLTPAAVLSHNDEKRDTHAVTIFYEAPYQAGEVRTDPREHDAFVWCSTEEALGLPLAPPTREALLRRASQ